ncbi:MAG: lamin tail domain-containing protein [bacterium]|nr:lamin tail domain-containing protein [bacterium]
MRDAIKKQGRAGILVLFWVCQVACAWSDTTGSTVVINEINYNSSDAFNPEDWVEFYNFGAERVDLSGWIFKDEDAAPYFTFPEGTTLEPGAYLIVCRDTALFRTRFPDVIHPLGNLGFGFSGGGDLLRLYDAQMGMIDSLFYDDKLPWPPEANGRGATLALLDPGRNNTLVTNWKASDQIGGTPGQANSPRRGRIVINEFMARNVRTIADPQGEYDDWIELYNLGDEPVDLSGTYLSDNLAQKRKWALPDTVLPARGFLLIWADEDVNSRLGVHASFRLSSSGEQLGLFDRDVWGNAVLDSITFGAQQQDQSVGRLPDGTGVLGVLAEPTPLARNGAGRADFDGDGWIGFGDFLLFAGAFGKRLGMSGYDVRFDLDLNGEIGFSDFQAFIQNFNRSSSISS